MKWYLPQSKFYHSILSIPLCKTVKEFDCAYGLINPSYNELVRTPYPKTCTIIQYSGEIKWEDFKPEREVYFVYNFQDPKTVSVHEEYLIYDTIGFMGSLGGTLGMFIGFSINNTFSTFVRFIVFIKSKLFDWLFQFLFRTKVSK